MLPVMNAMIRAPRVFLLHLGWEEGGSSGGSGGGQGAEEVAGTLAAVEERVGGKAQHWLGAWDGTTGARDGAAAPDAALLCRVVPVELMGLRAAAAPLRCTAWKLKKELKEA